MKVRWGGSNLGSFSFDNKACERIMFVEMLLPRDFILPILCNNGLGNCPHSLERMNCREMVHFSAMKRNEYKAG